MTDLPLTPGQAAYEKWKELTATQRRWEHLHPAWRKRWEQVAEAAIEQCGDDSPRTVLGA
jgi:hypothetical protein